jgi:hypothetical protein
MAQADSGDLGELSNPPWAGRIAEHHTEHLRGFRLEQRLEVPSLEGWLAGHEPFDKHAVENEPGVAFEVEKSDIIFPTQPLRLRREIRRNEDWRCFPSEVGDGIAQLEQGGTHMTWLTAGLHFADKYMSAAGYI